MLCMHQRRPNAHACSNSCVDMKGSPIPAVSVVVADQNNRRRAAGADSAVVTDRKVAGGPGVTLVWRLGTLALIIGLSLVQNSITISNFPASLRRQKSILILSKEGRCRTCSQVSGGGVRLPRKSACACIEKALPWYGPDRSLLLQMATEASETAASLPYHEPDIITILVLTSFLLLLNTINAALDKVLYCGLLGQVLMGIAWGTPGAKWLTGSVQDTVVQIGYLGLILLVYEGMWIPETPMTSCSTFLSRTEHTSMIMRLTPNRRTPYFISVAQGQLVAFLRRSSYRNRSTYCLLIYTTGPINATPVQAFGAGAALCSTSLGTTFTVLGASGLASSRLGVVLTSAAMMDDVVGLVMVQVISNLGGDSFTWVTIVRPILVSIVFAALVPIICLYVVKPLTSVLNSHRAALSTPC